MLNIDPTVLTEWIRAYSVDGFAPFGLKDYSKASISLTDDQRAATKAICRRRKVDILVWKRARDIFFLDTKKNPKTVFQILNICRTVLTKWCRAFSAEKFAFFDLTDCSQCDGLLTFTQEEELKKHFTEHLPLKAGEICACVLAEYSQNYGASGASKFMKLLGFVYKNPIALSMQADEDAQRKFIDWYEALRGSLGNNETILFADAVPPRVSKPFGSCLVPEGSIDGN